MEKEINEILGMLYDIYNQVMVLNDSLQLSARDNKDNDYQHSFSEIILKNLADDAQNFKSLIVNSVLYNPKKILDINSCLL